MIINNNQFLGHHPTGLPSVFSSGDGPILFFHYNCTGDEQTLMDCTRLPLLSSCSHDSDAGVKCTGEMRNITSLINSSLKKRLTLKKCIGRNFYATPQGSRSILAYETELQL